MHMSTEQCQSQTDAKGVRLSGLACVECPMSQEEKRMEGRELHMLVGRRGRVGGESDDRDNRFVEYCCWR